MKTYLVTGGAGFIGSNFIHYMLKRNQDIHILNVDALTYAGNLENLSEYDQDPRYTFAHVDIRDKEALTQLFEAHHPDYVINFAAESHVDRSIEDPGAFADTNVMGTVALLSVAESFWNDGQGSYGNHRYLQVSTDEVYGSLPLDDPEAFFRETTPLSPHSPYSASKASADMFVKAWHDTYGFPVELTEEIAEEAGMTVDREGFEAAMKEQQERARASAVKGGSMGMQNETLQNITVESVFNYNASQLPSKLVAIVADNAEVETVSEGTASLFFAETPFYAEMGGQVADHGQILDAAGNLVATVIDVQKAPNGQALHTVEVLAPLALNQEYTLAIDTNRRHRVMKNHTATHLLHAALHNILGNHATQAGSLNEVEFLRFDFTHFQAVTPEELRAIEQQVNEKIWEAIAVETVETDIDTAKEMGAMALFGEKYGKEVRVVTIGDYSIELCGGTHVGNTSEIGLFKIVKEEGIGSGTRRILAVTGKEAFEAYREQEDALKAVAATLKAPQLKEVPHKVEGIQEQLRQLQKENAELKEKAAAAAAGDVFKDVKEVNGHRYIASQVSVSDAGALRTFADNWKQKDYSDVLVLVAAIGDKVNVLVASKTKDVHAGNLVKELAPIVDGRGGGKPDMAMAGGSNQAKIQELLDAVAGKL